MLQIIYWIFLKFLFGFIVIFVLVDIIYGFPHILLMIATRF